MRDTPQRATVVYLLFTLLFSSVIWSLIIWSGHLGMGFGMMIVSIMWCPALAAMASCRVLGRDVRALAWRWPEWKYIASAYFVPLAYTAIAYGGVWALRLGGWNQELVGPGCAAFRIAPNFSLGGVRTVAGVYSYSPDDSRHGNCSRRRNRLARLSRARVGEADVLNEAEPAERLHLGRLA